MTVAALIFAAAGVWFLLYGPDFWCGYLDAL